MSWVNDKARGEVLVTMDGDCQNDPADIPALLKLLEKADAVCGFRGNRRDTWARRIGSRLKVRVGEPIPFSEIAHIEDRAELVMELRKRTFALARPEDIKGLHFDLHLREARIKGGKSKADE